MSKTVSPIPLFDIAFENIPQNISVTFNLPFANQDGKAILDFLKKYDGNLSTFENYKRETERLCQWAWLIAKKSILTLNREDIENYIKFCQKPPKSWIGTQRATRFIDKEGQRVPNPKWRPFVSSIGKSEYKHGQKADINDYKLSQQALALLFAALSSFYNHLLQENLTTANPVAQIKQKNKFIRQYQSQRPVKRLSALQWEMVIETAEAMANATPQKHERTLFIITALYLMYLRISELVAKTRWAPEMGHFFQDSQGNWWFKSVETLSSFSQTTSPTLTR